MRFKIQREGFRPIEFSGEEIAKVAADPDGGKTSVVFKTDGGAFVATTGYEGGEVEAEGQEEGSLRNQKATIFKSFDDLMIALYRWVRRGDENADALLQRVTEWATAHDLAASLSLQVP